MTDHTNAIQSGLRTRILALSNAITQVYDQPDGGAVFPYVTFGEIVKLPNHSKDLRFCNYTVTLHVWTRSAGSVQAQSLMADITDELDNTVLDLGADTPSVYFVSSTVIKDPDGATQHGVLRFQVRD